MKYYIGNIDEQYGEFEVEQSFLFATAGDADQLMERLAKEWYGAEESELDSEGLREGMYWNHFEMAYGAGSHYEVTKATYDELKAKRVFTEIYADEEVKYDRTPKTFEEDSDD
jgi:hypothetical protein